MAKLLFSFMLISCLILVIGNVIPNHINSIGNAINVNSTAERSGNPVEECKRTCKETGQGGLCKYNCEMNHVKRADQDGFKDCEKKCMIQGDAQTPSVCECRRNCDKYFPRNVFIW